MININILAQASPKYNIIYMAIFGSFARGDFSSQSDIDILVKFEKRKSLLEIVRIQRELSELIGNPVDLLTEKSISPYIMEKIKHELKVIYDKR
ncbi:MAG: nucleotidyltransferase family protein [Armatimonadota bacterium]